jgi:ribosomal protein L11 methyltransferase
MIYIEITLDINPLVPFTDIIMCELGEVGCESFVNTNKGFKAYIPKDLYDENLLKQTLKVYSVCEIKYTIEEIPDQNWNAVWESTHEPVMVDDFCWVYAPFHGTNNSCQYNMLIEPKMSFGTAHHSTTYMMLSFIKDEKMDGKRVLDMGSGTGVIAILAEMRGAKHIEAIDNDEWAYRNALENVEKNNCQNIEVLLGDASLLTDDKKFDIIIANINRNILLRDMHSYITVLEEGGTLLLSGFYHHDIPSIQEKAENLGMKFDCHKERNEWVACRFVKI